jgi:cytochrome P450
MTGMTGMSEIAPIVDFDDQNYNPFVLDEAVYGSIEDIDAVIGPLRARGPVHRGEMITLLGWKANPAFSSPHYSVFGFPEVMSVDGDPGTYSVQVNEATIGLTYGRSISVLDAPAHTGYRRVFQKAFLPNIVAKWGDDLVEPVVNGLIDQFIARGEADLVKDFAFQYPFQIIYKQLALPERDIATFHKLAASLTHTYGDYILLAQEASRKLGAYFAAMIAERRKKPGSDLVSLLIQAEVEGERLPDEVLISFFRQLVNAAGDTTYRGTGNLFIGLLRNPDQLAQLQADRSLVPSAIEEAVRWEGPVTMHSRSVMRDATLAGVDIPEGAILDVFIWGANHDPRAFPDPTRFDINRKRARHLAFGYGPHLCLGQHLARLEMTRALNAILDRLSNLRLNPAKPPPRITGAYFRTPRDVNVLFG